ncbi:MAG: phage tail tape measure protein, partial [Deltaproteobacteria bacterium]|nr:phage tail tape measure protein [Deltaproteobacteria bacterium]
MADKDVNIHVRAKDADQAKRDIDRTAGATEDLGKKTEQAGRKSEQAGKKTKQAGKDTEDAGKAAGKAKGAFASFATKLAAWAAAMVSIGAAIKIVTGAINANKRALNEHADVAVAQQQKLLRLQYLGDMFKERPELRKEVGALSVLGRRPFEEVADAWYNLRSKGGALSQQQRDSIMREALEMGRTDPDLPLDTLIDMFSLYAKKTGQGDANRIQNVLQQTITEAGGSGADVANYMPQFLPIGMGGKLTGAQAAGLWAYATTLGDAAVATTGLKAVFMGLEGKGSPEGKKILKEIGVGKDMDFFEKIGLLGEASGEGRFDLGMAEQVAGREGSALLLDLIKDPEELSRVINKVVGVDRGDIDLTHTKITELMGTDEVARLEEEIRGVNIQIANKKGADTRALRWKKKMGEREMSMRRAGIPEYGIQFGRREMEHLAGMGVSPDIIESMIYGDPLWEPDLRARIEALPDGKEKQHLKSLMNKGGQYSQGRAEIELRAAEKRIRAEPQATPPPAIMPTEAEPGIESEPVPAGDLSEGQSRVINYNEHYDYSMIFNPVAGNAEDRL